MQLLALILSREEDRESRAVLCGRQAARVAMRLSEVFGSGKSTATRRQGLARMVPEAWSEWEASEPAPGASLLR